MLSLLLLAAAPADQPRSTAERSADPRDRIICKRFAETGSLVRAYRTCKTKAEWDRERDNIRTLGVANSCRVSGQGGSCQ